jgi:hypothetical protein
MHMASLYERIIIELSKCEPEEAPLVEGFMRSIYGTLDALDRKTFRREAIKALRDVRENPRLALEVAQMHGLIRPPKVPS